MSHKLNLSKSNFTVVMIPCFSGAPWELKEFTSLNHYTLKTMRLPEGLDSIEDYADAVEKEVQGLSSYILVGDSFGAVISLALATRQPMGLKGLVISGGFAADPITTVKARLKIIAARTMPRLAYKALTLRFHSDALASPYDKEGNHPWSKKDSYKLFVRNTPHHSYVARTKAAFSADYRNKLKSIAVPTLVLTPSHDELIGPKAAKVLRDGIKSSQEVILPRTGHMFRFSHPYAYGKAIDNFIKERVVQAY